MLYKTNYCDICGRNYESLDTHHLIMGFNRTFADEDKLTVKVCRNCHKDIHNNAVTEGLSKMLGQQAYEFDYIINKYCVNDVDKAIARTEAREMFRKRYQINYLP